jgi:phosphatidylserine/phosphatidylglycerophosphate/cardiolipin synthase-like enzyme
MLNVAVSRAKDSFLVFGDMEIFQPGQRTPSGLLATHLFQDPEQEITSFDFVAAQLADDSAAAIPVERIDTLEQHREQLAQAMEQARDRLLIVSPYLSRNAIREDEIPDRVQACSRRGVEVTIAYCRDLMGRRQKEADELRDLLEASGAIVLALDRVHNKSLAVDSDWIVEGSFNWLSASRNPRSAHHRYEVSMLCRSPQANEMIGKLWRKLQPRIDSAR